MPDAFGALGEPRPLTEIRVRKTARALIRHKLGNAFGHVSARMSDTEFLVGASKALNAVEPGDEGTLVPIDGSLPDGVLGEVRVHQQIYRRRPDVNGIVRTFAPNVLTLSAMGLTPKPRHGFGCYFAPCPPIWMETDLLRDDQKAAEVANMLDDAKAIVLRGNGCVVTGGSIEEAAVMTYFLDSAATVELSVLAAGDRVTDYTYTKEQAARRAVTTGGVIERKWAYLSHGDPE